MIEAIGFSREDRCVFCHAILTDPPICCERAAQDRHDCLARKYEGDACHPLLGLQESAGLEPVGIDLEDEEDENDYDFGSEPMEGE